ncbi:hypothetical protein ACFQ0I_14920 [Mariniflexile aquimaris]|uniref:Uncharacterized protein n=1 Tax=Mariniflexile aquimaris TaxID=881009 RepID=A0ABW3BVR2_9FLAO
MDELQLHAFGQHDHLECLKKKYDSLSLDIKGNKKLTESEKKSQLETLTKSFEKEKKEAQNNLY